MSRSNYRKDSSRFLGALTCSRTAGTDPIFCFQTQTGFKGRTDVFVEYMRVENKKLQSSFMTSSMFKSDLNSYFSIHVNMSQNYWLSTLVESPIRDFHFFMSAFHSRICCRSVTALAVLN